MTWWNRLKRKHLTLVSDKEGKDPWFHRDWGHYFTYRCDETGKEFTKFEIGNYMNLCVSFTCDSCGKSFLGDQIDQPYVQNVEQRLKEYYGEIQ